MNLETDIPLEEKPKRKTRARKPKALPNSSLIRALKLVQPLMKKAGDVSQQHCLVHDNLLVASTGMITIGTRIQEDLSACPHVNQFLDALQCCEEETSITQLSDYALSVMSGDFKAVVACVTHNEIERAPELEEAKYPINDSVKNAFAALLPLVSESPENLLFGSVLLQSGSAVATNGACLVEYWHGLDLPTIFIPKQAASIISKHPAELQFFGFSGNAITFYFSDESFVRTELYNLPVPEYQKYLNIETDPKPLPKDFFKAVESIRSFSKDETIYFKDGFVSSNQNGDMTTFKIKIAIESDLILNSKHLMTLKHLIEKIDFSESENCLFFYSDFVRGRINGFEVEDAPF